MHTTTFEGGDTIHVRPAAKEWLGLLAANREAARDETFVVAGRDGREVRTLARDETLAMALAFSAGLGIEVDPPRGSAAPVVASGHQPDLYHPGVWVKNFLVDLCAERAGGTALNFIVDSGSFDTVGASMPCIGSEVRRCTEYLAVGSQDACYACADVPTEYEIDDWAQAVARQIDDLGVPSIAENYRAFVSGLLPARSSARNLAEFLTLARRRFEVSGGTSYLEVPVSRLCRTEAFAAFVTDLALDAQRLHEAYNGALDEYRASRGTRSAAQPFPDLARTGPHFELPLWSIEAHRRQQVWCERAGSEVVLLGADGTNLVTLPGDFEGAIEAVRSSKVVLVPKALALTMYVRGFVCDLFVHGLGGSAYDEVTDEVFARYFGIAPPAYTVATATFALPLGLSLVGEDEVSAGLERVNRFEHNPDAWLGEAEFLTADDRERAASLAAEKGRLTQAIGQADADKKQLGLRIRAVNAELGALMAPVRGRLHAELAELRARLKDAEVLSDRTYPFCFWSPSEVSARVGSVWEE